MSENEYRAAPRRRRADRSREEIEASAASIPPEADTGTRYAVGNAGRGHARFGEGQRMTESQNQWAVPPYASGSYDTVAAGGQTGRQDPWVSGVHDVVYTPWNAQDPDVAMRRTGNIPLNPEARKKKKRILILAISLAAAVAVIVALIIFLPGIMENQSLAEQNRRRSESAAILRQTVAPYDNRFCENVWVDGVHLGGMTQDEARAAVARTASDRNWTITLTWNGELYDTITPATTGVTYDTEAALYNAWQQGHVGTDAERAAAMEALQAEAYRGDSLSGEPDLTQVEARVSLLADQLYVPPEDAYLKEFDALRTDPFVFEPEKPGTVLDTEALEAQISAMIHGSRSGSVELAGCVHEMPPTVTVASLRAEKYTLIGQGTTSISTTSTYERNQNIRRAFDLINGRVIKPGKQFSFNAIVGERTEKNGFFPAPEYVYGEHVEGIGGGVCQASSTIYLAAIRANLRINKRTQHSLEVNYTDKGKDATVYWYDRHKVDLAFTNSTEDDIYITAAVQSDPKRKNRWVCVVNIYGRSLGEGITYDIVTEETVIPAPEEPDIRRDKDAKYVKYKDEEYVLQEAADGTSVESWRVKYVNGVEESREHLFTDTYNAKQQIIYVGTRERPAE